MSTRKDKYRSVFTADEYVENTPIKGYIQDQFNKFLIFLQGQVPEMAEGQLQTIPVLTDGETLIEISQFHRITNVTITPEDGTGPYLHDLILPVQRAFNSRSGDRINMHFAPANTAYPSLRVILPDSTVLFTKTYNGSGLDSENVTFILKDDVWSK
ncbi:MAG: hypothetical protein HC840_01220 [Leptolyngbyaceae cyanobacterium RM2_2_4]|nr:hypothetical protein [Leptolyngbyaceae cyanobacterium RM2_2_4]